MSDIDTRCLSFAFPFVLKSCVSDKVSSDAIAMLILSRRILLIDEMSERATLGSDKGEFSGQCGSATAAGVILDFHHSFSNLIILDMSPEKQCCP